jgi:hypothetical protein
MAETLSEALADVLRQKGVGDTDRDRAEFLGTDAPTFSKILRGLLNLTRDRAEKWAARVHGTDDPAAAALVQRLLLAAQTSGRPATVAEFCDSIRADGGVVGGERILDLFAALTAENIRRPLICVEYRDVPRAGRIGRYEGLASALTEGIANKLGFVMFQPFGSEIPLRHAGEADKPTGPVPSVTAATYMLQVREKCRAAYAGYRRVAEDIARGDAAEDDADANKAAAQAVASRLGLYERQHGSAYLGSGLQAKALYLQYGIAGDDGRITREERIFEWMTTPVRDLLIYMGDDPLLCEAIRDTLYPIPHFFSLTGRLPPAFKEAHDYVVKMFGSDVGLPAEYDVWQRY